MWSECTDVAVRWTETKRSNTRSIQCDGYMAVEGALGTMVVGKLVGSRELPKTSLEGILLV